MAAARSLPSRSDRTSPAWRHGRGWNLALVATFLIALVVPLFDVVFGLDPNPSPVRDTVAFPRPHLDRSLLKWPGSLLWYLKSTMGFRGTMVRAHGKFVWSVLGDSPAPESVMRAEPWLFLKSERAVDDYRRVDPFAPQDLDRWVSVLRQRQRWLAARGIRYLVVVAPNKETVYANAVPPWVTCASGLSRLQALSARLRAETEVDLLDLTSALESEPAGERLYHFTDTHWNDLGAFVGYRAIMRDLAASFPAVHPLDRDSMVEQTVVTGGGDLARMCGLQLDVPEPQLRLALRPGVTGEVRLADGEPLTFDRMDVRGRPRLVTRAPEGEIAGAVILRDSFGEGLLPYLSRHFRTATWIWTYDFPSADIEAEKPAVVIEQMVERKLMVLDPSPLAADGVEPGGRVPPRGGDVPLPGGT